MEGRKGKKRWKAEKGREEGSEGGCKERKIFNSQAF